MAQYGQKLLGEDIGVGIPRKPGPLLRGFFMLLTFMLELQLVGGGAKQLGYP